MGWGRIPACVEWCVWLIVKRSLGACRKACSTPEIGVRVGRDRLVVSRELARDGGRGAYRAHAAEEAARVLRERPKQLAVDRYPRLRAVVHRMLTGGWSPASIAGRLPTDYPDDQACRVSHEAIYTWVYAQPVSSLARELISLRTGRRARRGGADRPRDPVSGSPATWRNAPPRWPGGRWPGTGTLNDVVKPLWRGRVVVR